MPIPGSYAHGAHSAVLTLSFDLLQQVVQQHLFAGSRKPIHLSAPSADGQQRYDAQLDRCLLTPALRNQCALVFGFKQIETTGPRYQVGERDLELVCLVDLVQENDWGTEGAFLTFAPRLLVEKNLTASAAGMPTDAWPYYPGVNREATAALLPELERLVRERLRLNLCQLNGYGQAAHDPAALWGATIGEFRVVGGLQPRLDLYYHASAGAHGHGPSPAANLPLQPPANAGLLIGNEHLLYQLVLPALAHLYYDPDRLEDLVNSDHSAFPNRFVIGASSNEAGGVQATNVVLLKPLHAHIGQERTDGVSHFVSRGDLTVEINGAVRVTVIYTLMPAQEKPQSPDMVIKIKQTYAFRLPSLAGGVPGLVLENQDLRVWGVTTSAGFSAQAAAFVKREMERYVLSQAAATVFGWALSLLPRFGPRRLRRGLQATAPSAGAGQTTDAAPALPALPETAAVALPIYQVDHLEPFATTTEPNTALPMTDAGHDRLLAAVEPSRTQSVSADLRRCEAVVELNSLLVERKNLESVWRDFYATGLRRLLTQLLRATPASAPASYLLGFASHYWLLNCQWNRFLLTGNQPDLTVNALLARQFYGRDYLDRTLLEEDTRQGLQWVVDSALHSLLNVPHSTLLSATLRADGLYAQFSCQAADLKVLIGPMADASRPGPEVPSVAEKTRHERLARQNVQQVQRDLQALAEDFQDFWANQPDKPDQPDKFDALLQKLAQERTQAKQQLAAAQDACLGYLAYAVGKIEENDHRLSEADELTQARTTAAIFSAVAQAATGLDQGYQGLQNEALLRLKLGSRWELPAFSVELHRQSIAGFTRLVQQLHANASSHPTYGWGRHDGPPPLSFLIGQLPQWLASFQEEANTLAEKSRAFNYSLYLDSQLFQTELVNVAGLTWDADSLSPYS